MGASCSGSVRTFPEQGQLDLYAGPEAVICKPDMTNVQGSAHGSVHGSGSMKGSGSIKGGVVVEGPFKRRRRASRKSVHDEDDTVHGRRLSSFCASAVPASPSLRRKSAVPTVAPESSNGFSSDCSSASGSSKSLNGTSGPFNEPGTASGSPRRANRISWCEVKQVSTFRVKAK